MDHLRIQINEALTFEHYEDAAKMQVTLDAVLQLCSTDRTELSMDFAGRAIGYVSAGCIDWQIIVVTSGFQMLIGHTCGISTNTSDGEMSKENFG